MRVVQKQQNEKDDSLTVPATTVYTVFGAWYLRGLLRNHLYRLFFEALGSPLPEDFSCPLIFFSYFKNFTQDIYIMFILQKNLIP